MSFNATVYRVLIASPGDLVEERAIISDAIYRWNAAEAADAGAVLLPVMWETHLVPEMGDRPQAIVNRRMVADCDLLVGAFWTRLGTPTGASASGTLEEIEEFIRAGKPALLYFSSRETRLDHVDLDQVGQVREARKRFMSSGLVDQFSSPHELREKLAYGLRQQVRRLVAQAPAVSARRPAEEAEPKHESVIVTATVPYRHADQFTVAIRNRLPVVLASHSGGESREYTDLSLRFRLPIAASIVVAAVRSAAAELGGQVISVVENPQPQPGVVSISGTVDMDALRRVPAEPCEPPFRYEDYWKAFRAALSRSGSRLRPPTLRNKNWVRFPAGGAGARLFAFTSTRERYVGVELVLDRAQHAATFQRLRAERAQIEGEIGRELDWTEHDASYRIALTETGRDPADPTGWPQQHAWFAEKLGLFYAVLVKRLDKHPGLATEDPSSPGDSGQEPGKRWFQSVDE